MVTKRKEADLVNQRVAVFYGIRQLFTLPALFYCEETTVLFKWLVK